MKAIKKQSIKSLFIFSLAALVFTACNKDEDPVQNAAQEPSLPAGIWEQKVYTDVEAPVSYTYGSESYHTLDFFEATDNDLEERPLVILSPGGGFLTYNEVEKLRLFAQDLSQRGYAVALIQYKIGAQDAETYLKATQDVRSAIRYFRKNATQFRIDTDNILLGGWSNGAQISLTAGFLKESEVDEIQGTAFRIMIRNAVDDFGWDNQDNLGYSTDVRAVLGMFLYTFDTLMVDAGDPAMMMINHQGAHLSNGTNTFGVFTYGGLKQYGTEPLNDRFLNQGFIEGQDLDYIRISNNPGYKGTNEAPLHHMYYDQIADFYYRNLDLN